MAGERKAGAVLQFLGYVMERASDRSNSVLERATLQAGRAACHMLAQKIGAGAIADEHWQFLAGVTSPPVPEAPPKPRHRPFSSDYQSWRREVIDGDALEDFR
jgi:hypothetical protein